jgi:hypothetical protein
MSFAPQTLLDLRDYLQAETGLSDNELGIVGDANHTSGYHLGEDRLPKDDYSARTARDIAGLSDAASASDIGWFDRLVELTDYLVAEARAGHLHDGRELIGPASDGRAYRYDSLSGWKAQQRADGDPHEWHLHVSWYRDSEFRDKVELFKGFFDGNGGDDVGFDTVYTNKDGHKRTVEQMIVDLFDGSYTDAYAAAFPTSVSAGIAELKARPPVEAAPVDPDALKAVLLDPEVLAAIAKAVTDEIGS